MTQESYFLNYLSLMCNLYTYYFVVGLIVNLSKFHRLEKQKLVKERWVASRQNAEDFKRFKSWDRNESAGSREREMSFFSFSNIVLLLSNTFLLLANIFIVISTLPLELAYDSFYEGYVSYFLGLGVSMSWINAATVLSTIETFQVVRATQAGLRKHPQVRVERRDAAVRRGAAFLRLLVRRVLHVPRA